MLYAPTHLKQALWVLILAIMALTIACGSGEPAATTAPSQPSPTATTQPASPPAPTAPALPTEIPAATDDASPAQPEITATPAGERGTPPERPQTRSEPTPAPQPETPTSEEPTAPPPTAIPATAIPAAAIPAAAIPAPTSEYLYEETSAETDRTVLELFYERTEGRKWKNRENWMTEAPLDEWYGITTNAQGRVTEINLDQNDIEGAIPLEIGNLSDLTILNLSSNGSIRGQIPSEIGNLLRLETLDLRGNRLGGPIPPEIGNLSNLRFLNLHGNELSGEIPAVLGSLAKLETINLSNNRLGFDPTNGERTGVPEELGNLTNLTILLISPQDQYMQNPCLPSKLKGQLRTDIPSFIEITPFCKE